MFVMNVAHVLVMTVLLKIRTTLNQVVSVSLNRVAMGRSCLSIFAVKITLLTMLVYVILFMWAHLA